MNLDNERKAFEDWAKKETNWDLYWSENIKQYMDHQTNGAWLAWQARVPEGYAVVPKLPTENMINSGLETECGIDDWTIIHDIYQSMLEAVEK